MKNKKAFYQALPEYNGYKWAGYWDNFHHFIKPLGSGWYEIRATDADILDGNIKDMADYNVTK